MSRIIRLESNNIMCLKAIDITPGDGSIVKIVGANDAGKTANLKCIWMALGGKKEIPKDVIRAGEDRGFVLLTIGDGDTVEYTARLNLKRRPNGDIKAEEIILKNNKGRTENSPMAMLADMLGFGRAQFDPLLFAGAKPADQVAMLKTALGLDFSELDSEYDEQYKQRTDVNRDAKNLAAQIGNDDPDAPDAEVSVAELAQQHAAAIEAKASNDRHTTLIAEEKAEVERDVLKYQQLKLDQEELDNRIKYLAESVETANTAIDALEAEPLSEVPNIDVIAEKIKTAEADNARARDKVRRKALVGELRDLKARSETITESLATIKATRDKMVADAEFPIQGVVIDDNQILIHGHPLANQGGAAQLRFGAMLVIMSKPKLKIITMDEALGKLDDESIEMLDVILKEHGFQAWLTGPRAVGEGCIEIRNGEIVTE